MKYRKTNITFSILPLLSGLFATNAIAAPYQLEAGVSTIQITRDIERVGQPLREEEIDELGVRATYYLQPVDITSGPLEERAFLDKAAYLTGTFEQSELDVPGSTKTDTMTLESRFVLESDLFFDLRYSKEDDGSSSDSTTLGFSVGKYLSNNATALIGYEQEDNGSKSQSLGGAYKFVTQNESNGTWRSTTFALGANDVNDSTGLIFGLEGKYFPNERLSVGFGLFYTEEGDVDAIAYDLSGQYFLSESLFGVLGYRKADAEAGANSANSSQILIELGARF